MAPSASLCSCSSGAVLTGLGAGEWSPLRSRPYARCCEENRGEHPAVSAQGSKPYKGLSGLFSRRTEPPTANDFQCLASFLKRNLNINITTPIQTRAAPIMNGIKASQAAAFALVAYVSNQAEEPGHPCSRGLEHPSELAWAVASKASGRGVNKIIAIVQ